MQRSWYLWPAENEETQQDSFLFFTDDEIWEMQSIWAQLYGKNRLYYGDQMKLIIFAHDYMNSKPFSWNLMIIPLGNTDNAKYYVKLISQIHTIVTQESCMLVKILDLYFI